MTQTKENLCILAFLLLFAVAFVLGLPWVGYYVKQYFEWCMSIQNSWR